MRGLDQYSVIAWVLFLSLAFPVSSRAVEFAAAASYPVGTSPSVIIVGDFNGDGKSDLAVANLGSSNISILLNNGDGTFKAAVSSPAGTAPQAMAAGDFNGDGKLDLVVTNAGNSPSGVKGAVFLLPGNGDGTLQTPVQLQADPYPLSIAAADLNADRKPDLIVGDAVSGGLTILLGKGDGTFQLGSAVILASGGAVGALSTADFNADNKLDVVAAISSGPVLVVLGNGDGTFSAPAQIGSSATSPHLLVGDFTGDGKADLVLRSEAPRPPSCRQFCFSFDRITIFSGKGDGTFNGGASVIAQFNSSAGNLATGDFNSDSKQDLIEPRFGSGLLFLGHNNGTFLILPPLWTGLGAFVASADLNGDNLPDLAVTDVANSAVAIFLNLSPTSGADLSVTEPATSNVIIGGDDLTYRATVLNQGPQDATGVTLKETLPASFTLVSSQPSQGTCSGSTTITCVLGDMADPSSATVDFTVRPTAPGTFTDAVHVTATQPDLNSKNDSASMTITAVLPADVGVSGSASETVAKIGDSVTFSITVTNHGPATANNVSLNDSLSDALPVSSLTITQGSCTTQITCTIGTLASGASAKLTFTVAMATAEVFTNNLSASSDQPDLNGDNNNATINVTVNPAELVVTQTASGTSITAGTQLTLTAVVANNGPATANNVALTELLQGGGAISSATTSQGSCSPPSGGQITCSLGTLTASATATVTIPVTFTDVGQWTNTVAASANEPDPDSSNNSVNLNFDVAPAPDFSISPAATSLTVHRGASGTDVLTFTSLGGFSNPVSLACTISGPAPMPSCAMSPTSVTPGANPVTATLTLTAPSAVAGLLPSNWGIVAGVLFGTWLPLALIGISVAPCKSKERRRLFRRLCSLALLSVAFQAACGGGSGPPPPSQNYAVTVTATSGAISRSTQIQATVQ